MGTGYNAAPGFGDGSVTLFGGQSADELSFSSTDQTVALNTIAQDNGNLKIMWSDAYTFIYQANLCIEGLDASTLLDAANKARFRAEARFVRAFNYFYLVNLWGDVPYVTTSDWTKTFGTGRTPTATIYNNIVDDLLAAQTDMPAAYPAAGKVRPIRLTATALLARVYLYMGEWAKADAAASVVINSGVYPKLPDPANAFLKNSDEAIWQLIPLVPSYNTQEGYQLNYASNFYRMLPGLVSNFEAGDLRFTNWVKVVGVNNYVNKYKVRTTTANNGLVTEYYTMLRLGEQYLIRAEAKLHESDIAGAVTDLNVIRKRAGLTNLATTLTADQCTAAIEKERRSELFAEWGHRWLDLKRTGKANAVLSALKPSWKSTAVLYPIPLSELKSDPSLTQNDGYQ